MSDLRRERPLPANIARHGANGWKYQKAVPARWREIVGKKVWTKTLGGLAYADVIAARDRLNVVAAAELKALARLTSEQLADIKAAGGYDRWRERAATILEYDARAVPMLKWLASSPHSDALMDGERRYSPKAPELSPGLQAAVAKLKPASPRDVQAAALVLEHTARRELKKIEARAVHVASVTAAHDGVDLRPKLFALVDLYERDRPPADDKTRNRTRTYVGRFVACVGDLEAAAVTPQHVIRWRDALEEKHTPTNVNTHLGKLHALFATAVNRGLVALNPVSGIKALRREAKARKQPFDSSHVRKIFEALPDESADFQWIVRLLAYHGGRSKELGHLKCADIATLHGQAVFRILKAKNRFSVRDVPIYPKCKGIVAYAAKVAKAHGADAWLFESLTGETNDRIHKFHEAASKFLRHKLGIADKRVTMHGFRHLWTDLANEADMPEAVACAIQGHKCGKGEHANYGRGGVSLRKMAEWVRKVDPLNG